MRPEVVQTAGGRTARDGVPSETTIDNSQNSGLVGEVAHLQAREGSGIVHPDDACAEVCGEFAAGPRP
jgi:hypothetical protein